MVKDIRPGRLTFNDGRGGQEFAVAGGVLYFTASSDHVACDSWVDELWKSDGTLAGTVMVKDLGADTDPFTLLAVGDVLYFGSTSQLWKTDGTSSGTVNVEPASDFWPGFGGGGPAYVGGALYLAGQDDIHGFELWRTEEAPTSTVMVRDIRLGSKGSNPNYLTDVGGTAYFVADDGIHGVELWKCDGTDAGTVIVKDTWSGSASSHPKDLLVVPE
jgi:ELWxxDGT repeat protein